MYEIKKNGKHLSYEDVIRYVKLQSNGIYWKENVTPHLVWNDIEDGTIIAEDTVVVYDGKTWKCTSQHIKSSVYKPRTGSSKWVEVT